MKGGVRFPYFRSRKVSSEKGEEGGRVRGGAREEGGVGEVGEVGGGGEVGVGGRVAVRDSW